MIARRTGLNTAIGPVQISRVNGQLRIGIEMKRGRPWMYDDRKHCKG